MNPFRWLRLLFAADGPDPFVARQPRCDEIPRHTWAVDSVTPSEYDRTLEHGWRHCTVCGTRQTFTRERMTTPPQEDRDE